MNVRMIPTVLAIAMQAGCATEQPGDTTSAVEAEPTVWSLSNEPTLSIGIVDGDERYQLHQVVGAARLASGNIAVMNGGSSQLRIYSPEGEFISAHGAAGEGPGEFRQATRLHVIGDTLFAYDGRLQRQSLHDTSGAFLENRALRPEPGRFQLDEWLHDRSWIDGPPFGVGRAPVKEALNRLPAPDSIDVYRYVRVSPWGHLWVRQRNEPEAEFVDWRVYDLDARPIGLVQLPGGFEVYEYGRTCGIAIGFGAPPGWTPGVVSCQ